MNPAEKGFVSSRGIEFAFEEPKEREITRAQAGWLTNFVNEFETVLFSRTFADPTNGYAKYIDVDSFVDYHWFIEATRNVDAHWFSQFFHKDRGGKLKAGPVWDWDMAFGSAGYLRGERTNGWRWDQVKGPHYAWYDRLFEDEEFLQRYIDRWAELRRTVFVTSNILARIDVMERDLQPAAIRNLHRWYASHIAAGTNGNAAQIYRRQVERMKRWIEGRLAWIDSQGFPPPEITVVEVATGRKMEANTADRPHHGNATDPPNRVSNPPAHWQVSLSCPIGRIFYTTNGIDPRVRGGGVSAQALEYKGPLTGIHGDRLFARVRSDVGLWSPPARLGPQ